MSTARFVTLTEMVQQARTNLDRNDWDYLTGAADTETSLYRNRASIDSRGLVAQVLNPVSAVQEADASGEFLGHTLRLPVLLAPIGSIQAFNAEGGAAVARAAERFGVMNILSSACQPDFREVATASDNPKVYQLYVVGDDDWLFRQIEATVECGYAAFCLTVDTMVYSRRERDILKRYVPASSRLAANRSGDAPVNNPIAWQAQLSWEKVQRIKERFDIPLIVKGIQRAADAETACELGVEVVYVSNHGGRQLDQAIGTLDMLEPVAKAVDGRATVVVDGGIYRGTDILKARALGADVVGIGRLEAWAMAAAGEDGVVRMLEILEEETQIAMGLTGINRLDELTPDFVAPAQPVYPPSVVSAFPFLDEY